MLIFNLCGTALATEDPTPDLLLDKPHGRDEALISGKMWKHVLTQGVYQMFWIFLIFYGAPRQLTKYSVGLMLTMIPNVCCPKLVG